MYDMNLVNISIVNYIRSIENNTVIKRIFMLNRNIIDNICDIILMSIWRVDLTNIPKYWENIADHIYIKKEEDKTESSTIYLVKKKIFIHLLTYNHILILPDKLSERLSLLRTNKLVIHDYFRYLNSAISKTFHLEYREDIDFEILLYQDYKKLIYFAIRSSANIIRHYMIKGSIKNKMILLISGFGVGSCNAWNKTNEKIPIDKKLIQFLLNMSMEIYPHYSYKENIEGLQTWFKEDIMN